MDCQLKMSSYDFIIDEMKFSYSSVSSFVSCPYGFKLSYIDKMPRESNFYGEYGTLIHECMEKYFRDELESFELSSYFSENYLDKVPTPPPPYPAGLDERYKNAGIEFFDNFSFDKSLYEMLLIEGKLDFPLRNASFTGRPDLILKNKETLVTSLYDFKTSAPFWVTKSGVEKVDEKKMSGYRKQMYIYTYGIRNHLGINIDEIVLWFTRPSRFYTIPCDIEKEKEAVEEIESVIDTIKKEEHFEYNNSNNYFCSHLCGVRKFCEYW